MRIRPNCDLVARPKIEAISGSRWQMRLCGGGETVAGGGNLDGNATPEPAFALISTCAQILRLSPARPSIPSFWPAEESAEWHADDRPADKRHGEVFHLRA
eukprot:CAMPEP_0181256878 /NCGR_PEP_ID=MMETSP1096-20121128/49950_1 /TAXON_ID=156174 ORGANISM="Chrysochromulina ericina, Strain CCMP281" /NCGR_SAMPLE_ID=MMETSP1096 /ASSEMBLY_ACC=CAM_ASM_000453 /LENGTH=100 /DNA_ID=CAMNT_0023355167 /DNA_START=533 /DNA_END=835 /DNA_ORIENTATION=-